MSDTLPVTRTAPALPQPAPHPSLESRRVPELPVGSPVAPVAHAVTLVERGPFLQPTCSCGWSGAARRSRPTARAEGLDHALLFADGSALGATG